MQVCMPCVNTPCPPQARIAIEYSKHRLLVRQLLSLIEEMWVEAGGSADELLIHDGPGPEGADVSEEQQLRDGAVEEMRLREHEVSELRAVVRRLVSQLRGAAGDGMHTCAYTYTYTYTCLHMLHMSINTAMHAYTCCTCLYTRPCMPTHVADVYTHVYSMSIHMYLNLSLHTHVYTHVLYICLIHVSYTHVLCFLCQPHIPGYMFFYTLFCTHLSQLYEAMSARLSQLYEGSSTVRVSQVPMSRRSRLSSVNAKPRLPSTRPRLWHSTTSSKTWML